MISADGMFSVKLCQNVCVLVRGNLTGSAAILFLPSKWNRDGYVQKRNTLSLQKFKVG